MGGLSATSAPRACVTQKISLPSLGCGPFLNGGTELSVLGLPVRPMLMWCEPLLGCADPLFVLF